MPLKIPEPRTFYQGIPLDSLFCRPFSTPRRFQMDAMEEDPIIATSSSFPEGVLDVQGTPSYAPPPSCTLLSHILYMSMSLIYYLYSPIVSSHPTHPVFSGADTDKLPRIPRRSSQSAHKKTRKGLLGIPWTCARLSGDRWAVITCRYGPICSYANIVLIPYVQWYVPCHLVR